MFQFSDLQSKKVRLVFPDSSDSQITVSEDVSTLFALAYSNMLEFEDSIEIGLKERFAQSILLTKEVRSDVSFILRVDSATIDWYEGREYAECIRDSRIESMILFPLDLVLMWNVGAGLGSSFKRQCHDGTHGIVHIWISVWAPVRFQPDQLVALYEYYDALPRYFPVQSFHLIPKNLSAAISNLTKTDSIRQLPCDSNYPLFETSSLSE